MAFLTDSLPRSIALSLLFLYALIAWPGQALAQTTPPVLISDLNKNNLGSDPHYLHVVGDHAYFAADDGIHGMEPWRVNLTTGAAAMLADIYPGISGYSGENNSSNPSHVTALSDSVFFMASTETTGYAETLWAADGNGVRRLSPQTFRSDEYASNPLDPRCPYPVMDNVAYFYSYSNYPAPGELWRSDGTIDGTFLVKEIGFAPPYAVFDGFILFFNPSTTTTTELWRTDGTAAGTVRVGEPIPSYQYGERRFIAMVNGGLLFTIDKLDGEQIWWSDGTGAGTAMVAETTSGRISVNNNSCWQFSGHSTNQHAYFLHNQALWGSDGTAGGTHLLGSISLAGNTQYLTNVFTMGDRDYVQILSEVNSDLWEQAVAATDGTPAGTRWLFFLKPGLLVPSGDEIVNVGVEDGTTGVWLSDGTQIGTDLVTELPATTELHIDVDRLMYQSGMPIVFEMRDKQMPMQRRLWTTDGSASGTRETGTIEVEMSWPPYEREWEWEGLADGSLLFTGDSVRYGRELYRTDPTLTDSTLLADIRDDRTLGSAPSDFIMWQGNLYFLTSEDRAGVALWRAGVTGNNPVEVKRIAPAVKIFGLNATQDFLYFFVNTYDQEYDQSTLWRSDGTAEGTLALTEVTQRYIDTAPGSNNTRYKGAQFAATEDAFYFANDSLSGGCDLWRSTGSISGTQSLETGICPYVLVSGNGSLYFTSSSAGDILYALGAEEDVPVELFDISPMSEEIGDLTPIYADRGKLFLSAHKYAGYTARSYLYGWQPGMDAPEMLLNGRVYEMVSFDGMFYTATENAIWRTDGTVAGTQDIINLLNTHYLQPYDDHLYFISTGGVEGQYRFWRTDGTDAGTELLTDYGEWGWTDPTPYQEKRLFLTRAGDQFYAWRKERIVTTDPPTYTDACDLVYLDKESGAVSKLFPSYSIEGDYWTDPVCGPGLYPYSFLEKPNLLQYDGRTFFAQQDILHGDEPWVLSPDQPPAAIYSLTIATRGQGQVNYAPVQDAYAPDTHVTLTAEPAAGWYFAGWMGDAGGLANPLTLTINDDQTIDARFEPLGIVEYTLATDVEGQGEVSLSAPGPYVSGSQVTLTATPATGWRFAEWAGDASGTDNPLTVTMTSDKSITAHFERITYALTVNVEGQGAVTRSVAGPYPVGTAVRLTAGPTAGWRFVEWSGDASGTDNPFTIIMDDSKAVTAHFEHIAGEENIEIYLPIVAG